MENTEVPAQWKRSEWNQPGSMSQMCYTTLSNLQTRSLLPQTLWNSTCCFISQPKSAFSPSLIFCCWIHCPLSCPDERGAVKNSIRSGLNARGFWCDTPLLGGDLESGTVTVGQWQWDSDRGQWQVTVTVDSDSPLPALEGLGSYLWPSLFPAFVPNLIIQSLPRENVGEILCPHQGHLGTVSV